MATVVTKTLKRYKDLDLNFTAHPVKKDVNKHVDEMAVINSIKNLILTNHYERPFHPEIGSNINKLLFENMDAITVSALKREIQQVIQNFEPRANVKDIGVIADFDNNAFNVILEFYIINRTEPVTIEFFLKRER
jgi:phage baseplate assembly protein W